MNHSRREYSVLAAHASVQQANEDVGVFLAPAAVVGIEAVDTVEVAAPNREIARSRTFPRLLPQLAQRAERQREDGREPVDAAGQTRAEPLRKAPRFPRAMC